MTTNKVDCPDSPEDPIDRPSTSGENTPEFVVMLDATGVICYMSPAATDVLGYTPEMATGKSAIEFIHPDDCNRFAANRKRSPDPTPGSQPAEEYRVRDSQGNWRSIEAIRTDLPMALGGGLAIACRPIATGRQQASIRLPEKRNFIEAVLDTAGALVVVFDPQGRIVRFNQACQRLTQYSWDEVRGKCVWDLFLIPQEIEAVQDVFGQLLSSQQTIEYEHYWQAKDGSRHLIYWSNTVLCDGEGQVEYAIATGLDMTEHQRLEEIRFALRKDKELNQLQSHFFTMASHHFRTPLSTILLSAHSLEHSARDGSISQRLKKIHRIQLVAQSLTQTIGDLLTIERAETGHLEFDPHPLDLDVFCGQILKKTQRELGKIRHFTLKTKGELHGIAIDESLMRMTIENLLSNAIEYSPEGSEIELILIGSHRSVKLQVRDRGRGIPKDDRLHLFNAFFRGSNVKDIPGIGLGLTVVKKCVELHRGQISVVTEEGNGTTVTVKIARS
ncbi:MAG: PAS domain-containing sensor histidine kinase [Geitlerinemataceae cyanobacterium]